MSRRWRPADWKNPELLVHDEDVAGQPNVIRRFYISCHESNIYEAGADAIYQPAYDKGKAEGKDELLEALKKQGKYAPKHGPDDPAGYLVFIPAMEGE